MHRFLAPIPALLKEDDELDPAKVGQFGSLENTWREWQEIRERNLERLEGKLPLPPVKNTEPEFQQTWEEKLQKGNAGTDEPKDDSSDDEDGGAPLKIWLRDEE